ncbi:lipopolysaccharide-binding protein-like [Trichosurus vulpecula]|uniref:lipopolysaccharide-binding protein-like n=1 Tax=Trichosurus vulpecula TaxID=9337 RepID=UPI00186B4223|nr:lipopolysaccharide-binding protein-like [Trichosurus vulpecula]
MTMRAQSWMLVSLLLLLEVLCSWVDASNPGIVNRITQKGLDYACTEAVTTLEKELLMIKLPDFEGDFKIKHLGRGEYHFKSLNIQSVELKNSKLDLVPGEGLKASISNAFIHLDGDWRARKSFLKVSGSFDLQVKGISISVSLRLSSDSSGRPTVTNKQCSSHIADVDLDVSGKVGWLVNLFQSQIESKFRRILEDKICEIVKTSVASDLQPFLQSLPVIAKIDQIASMDYTLSGPPQATRHSLDTPFKGEFFRQSHRSTVPFEPPAMKLPEDHDLMVYFGISDSVFNTASQVYWEAGVMNYTITDDMIPSSFSIRLKTSSFRALVPQLGKLYPNMPMELQISTSSPPVMVFSPGNVTLTPVMDLQAFVILPSSLRVPLFLLSMTTTVTATMGVNASRLVSSVTPGSSLTMELKHSNIGSINVPLIQAILNHYALSTLLPAVNENLEIGFPLPLPRNIQLHDLLVQPYQDFLLLGANVLYTKK